MSDSGSAKTPPPLPASDVVTGEWTSDAIKDTGASDPAITRTASGSPTLDAEAFGIPNPFGRYTIERLLGRGGMGAVFLAHDKQLDRPVAVKIPTFGGEVTAAQKERFLREARAIASLRHPNICPVFDVGEEAGTLYLTMAYIDGRPLSTLLERGAMKPEEAVERTRKIARAMQAAHAIGTIHRDLKPANILIDGQGEPVVMDFGLARKTAWNDEQPPLATNTSGRDAGLTQFGSVLGTPAYMPPEQARGDVKAIGPWSDVYALGVILYEMLTGRRPFTAATTESLIRKIAIEAPARPTEFYPWIDGTLEAVCLRALAKEPADRFGTMAEFERALQEAVEPRLEVMVPPPLPRPTKPIPARRGSRKLWGCLAFFVALITICVGGPILTSIILVDHLGEKFKEFKEEAERGRDEWVAIEQLWRPPVNVRDMDAWFPPQVAVEYHRLGIAPEPVNLGLPLVPEGRTGRYAVGDGEVVQVGVYQRTDTLAKADLNRIEKALRERSPDQSVWVTLRGPGARGLSASTIQASGSRAQYYYCWYGQGWLFVFECTESKSQTRDNRAQRFAPLYLAEIGKMAAVPGTPAGP